MWQNNFEQVPVSIVVYILYISIEMMARGTSVTLSMFRQYNRLYSFILFQHRNSSIHTNYYWNGKRKEEVFTLFGLPVDCKFFAGCVDTAICMYIVSVWVCQHIYRIIICFSIDSVSLSDRHSCCLAFSFSAFLSLFLRAADLRCLSENNKTSACCCCCCVMCFFLHNSKPKFATKKIIHTIYE